MIVYMQVKNAVKLTDDKDKVVLNSQYLINISGITTVTIIIIISTYRMNSYLILLQITRKLNSIWRSEDS